MLSNPPTHMYCAKSTRLTYQLRIKVPHVEHPPCRLSYYRKGLGEQLVKGRSQGKQSTELVCKVAGGEKGKGVERIGSEGRGLR